MIHIRICLRALLVVWSLNTISLRNRFLLWIKSINLYLCFLGFTDGAKHQEQVWSAMIAAILSAVYDYETDWQATKNPEHSLFRQLLDQYILSADAKGIAYTLFVQDLFGDMSKSGLERGAVALRFYHAVIGSKWLGQYSSTEIDRFGERLQEVDDALDLDADIKGDHTNCLRTNERETHLRHIDEFIKSEFFAKLEGHALVYSLLRLYCQAISNRLKRQHPHPVEFFSECRPLAMIYASLATCMGFQLTCLTWIPTVISGLAFAGVTGSIMVFNDFMDRHHDTKKGKYFAATHAWLLGKFWLCLNLITVVMIALTLTQSLSLTLYIIAVWALGLTYSARPIRKWYVVQGSIVATCSMAPILAGYVYHTQIAGVAFLNAGIFWSIIFIREIAKDIQDQFCDPGYKETIPVRRGHVMSVVLLIMLCYVPATMLGLHPHAPVRWVGYGLGIVEAANAYLLLHPERIKYLLKSIDVVLAFVLIAAMISA